MNQASVPIQKSLCIMGIDPGVRPGLAIIEGIPGQRPILLYAKAIPTNRKDMLEARCLRIYQEVKTVIQTWQPALAAIEKIFVWKNATSALTQGHARCASMLPIAQAAIPLYQFDNGVIKKTLTGNGNAKKHKVQHAVMEYLALAEPIRPHDASDAAAIAITLWVNIAETIWQGRK